MTPQVQLTQTGANFQTLSAAVQNRVSGSRTPQVRGEEFAEAYWLRSSTKKQIVRDLDAELKKLRQERLAAAIDKRSVSKAAVESIPEEEEELDAVMEDDLRRPASEHESEAAPLRFAPL